MSSGAPFFDYWGKARLAEGGAQFHRLPYHCLDVAAVGAALLQADPNLAARLAACSQLEPESLRGLLPFVLSLHDLGKFSLRFQCLRADLVRELQGPSPNNRGYPTRHDAMGLALWCDVLALEGNLPRWLQMDPAQPELGPRHLAYLIEPWIRAVTGHHGQPGIDKGTVDEHFPRSERARRDAVAFVDSVATLFGPITLQFSRPLALEELESALKPSSWLLAGVAVLCDWVGSNTKWFPYQAAPGALDVYWLEAQDRAAFALKECGILPCQPNKALGMRHLFPKRAPRPMQRAADDVNLSATPQLFVLEDLTGSGKTEAAVVLAHRLMAKGLGGGIFFALPTMATANAMYERIAKVWPLLFEQGAQPSVVLAHSAPHLLALRDLNLPVQRCDDQYASEESSISTQCNAWIADSRKRALLAHVGVGTIDQALLAAMQVRHGTLRLLGVNRNILVVDEVHAYDAYMTEHLARLLEAQAALGASAILLSATLPTQQRQKLAQAFERGLGIKRESTPASAYPLLTQIDASGIREIPVHAASESRREVAVRFVDSPEAAVEFVAAAAKAGKCVCWIRNTVVDAMEAHQLLRERLDPTLLMLFHARYAMGDRLAIEREVLGRFGAGATGELRRGMALVATQVVEQSLDLDFDELVTDLAPMDLIIQRAGRLHRHARAGRGKPVLHVVAPQFTDKPEGNWFSKMFPRACHVYPHWGQVWLTASELTRRGALTLPEDARALMDAVFSSEARERVPEALEKASDADETNAKIKRSIARGCEIDLPGGYGGPDRIWDTDARAPTRLGEPSSTVRLVKMVDGRAKPWFESPKFEWDLSQVQIVRRRVAKTAPEDEAVAKEIESEMPFVDAGTVTVVLRQVGTEWQGHALDNEARRARILYDATIGLRVEKEG